MNSFRNIFNLVIMKHEGGSRDNTGDLTDKGGYTRFGISQFWKDKIDIKNCTELEARNFYEDYFFSRIKTGYHGLDLFLFDSLVQHDKDACIWLQEAIGLSGKQVDGIIGSVTRHRLKNTIGTFHKGEVSVLKKIAAKRMEHYMNLDDSYGSKYHKGWSNRFVDILSESLSLAVPF